MLKDVLVISIPGSKEHHQYLEYVLNVTLFGYPLVLKQTVNKPWYMVHKVTILSIKDFHHNQYVYVRDVFDLFVFFDDLVSEGMDVLAKVDVEAYCLVFRIHSLDLIVGKEIDLLVKVVTVYLVA